MSEGKTNDDLYRRVEEHLQELLEPDLPEARLSPAERLELLEQARSSQSCRELLESYEKTVSLLGALPDAPVPADFSRQVGERIDDSTPVIPFVRTVRFQRMAGAAAAVALMTFVIWRAVTPLAEESFPELAINEPLGEAAPEISADEPPIAPRVRDLSREKALAPLALKADSGAGDKEVAAADPAPVAADPAPVAVDAADTAVPDDSGTAAPGGVVEEVAGANESRRQKPGNSIEVSRESIDGRLVAVRYEVTIPRSRFGELEAWRRKQTAARPAAVAAPTAAEGASLLKSRARKASPPAGKSKDKSAEQDAGQPTGEFLTLLVDAGKLEALRSELAALQEAFPVRDRILRQGNNVRAKRQGSAAKRSVKALEIADFAAADAARGAEAKSAPAPEAAPPPGVPEKSRELARRAAPAKAKKAAPRESRAELKKDLRADSKLQVKLGSRAPGAAGKAAPGDQLKVRVEIRFRIVAD